MRVKLHTLIWFHIIPEPLLFHSHNYFPLNFHFLLLCCLETIDHTSNGLRRKCLIRKIDVLDILKFEQATFLWVFPFIFILLFSVRFFNILLSYLWEMGDVHAMTQDFSLGVFCCAILCPVETYYVIKVLKAWFYNMLSWLEWTFSGAVLKINTLWLLYLRVYQTLLNLSMTKWP